MQKIAELLKEAGLPKGVFNLVHGTVEVVNRLCAHPDIAGMTFVGSSRVAEIVATKCHGLNKRVLALGGAKNHLVAAEDCDVGMANKDIVASFAGCAGQRCMAASALILIDSPNSDNVLKAIVDTASKLAPGQNPGQVGPVIDGIAKERVLKYIADAKKGGAEILLDGSSWANKDQGFWVGPTVILHSNASDPALTEEIFGPVLSVIKVKTWEDAIAIENANPYGNAACIYTESGATAEWFTKRFNSAMMGVNIGIPVPREPFSFGGLYGTKSKYGDFDITGDGAMEFFTNRRKITSKWTASYSSGAGDTKRLKTDNLDKANFDGKM
jgi:acyl-CoA reductase-like NAD-dependent aldehyde dehydrogenase